MSKRELHSVLNCFQGDPEHGIFVCEAFRDPRFERLDAYWGEVEREAMGLRELHRLVGPSRAPTSDQALAQMNRFARLLERLSKRIDRAVSVQIGARDAFKDEPGPVAPADATLL